MSSYDFSLHLLFFAFMRDSWILDIIQLRVIYFFLCLLGGCRLLFLSFEAHRRHSGSLPFPFNSIHNNTCWVGLLLILSFPVFLAIWWEACTCKSSFWSRYCFWVNAWQRNVNCINGTIDYSGLKNLYLDWWRGGINCNIKFLIYGNSEWRPLQIGLFTFSYFVSIYVNFNKVFLFLYWLSPSVLGFGLRS